MIDRQQILLYQFRIIIKNGKSQTSRDYQQSTIVTLVVLLLKVIHMHLVRRKMFITSVWNDQQSFYLYHFHIIILPVLFVYVKFESIASLLSYSIIMYYPYDITLYSILYSHHILILRTS